MVEPELFLGQVQQVLKQGVLEVPQWDHKPPLGFPDVDRKVALGDIAVGGEGRSDPLREASMELLVLLASSRITHQLGTHKIHEPAEGMEELD